MIFKFKIGEEVKHTGYRKNLVVTSRMEYEDFNSIGHYYDCLIMDQENLREIERVPEYWLELGHRIE